MGRLEDKLEDKLVMEIGTVQPLCSSAAVPASAVFYLNAFDTIYVSMGGYGKLAGGANFNDIQIEKNN